MQVMLTRKEAASRLCVSTDVLDELRKEGKLSFIQHKPNGKVWITEDAINEYLARATHHAVPAKPVIETLRKRRVI